MPETIHVKSATLENGQRGPYVKVVDAKGDFYFVHDAKLHDQALRGGTLVAEVDVNKHNGQTFRRITAINSVAPNGTTSAPAGENRDMQIARGVCLKAAVDMSGPGAVGDESHLEWVMKVADRFMAWYGYPTEETPF